VKASLQGFLPGTGKLSRWATNISNEGPHETLAFPSALFKKAVHTAEEGLAEEFSHSAWPLLRPHRSEAMDETKTEHVDVAVVNVEHLMAYVDSQREEGNTAYKAKRHTEALEAWQRGLDALAQADGKPMRAVDVPIVQRATVTLHSNRGQALLSMQFWRRAIHDLDEALKIDAWNAKALWRRHQCHKALKAWAAAEADLEALLAPELQQDSAKILADAGLGAEQLAAERQMLREKRLEVDRVAAETFEERVEDAAAKGIEQLRVRFEEIIKRNGLHGNKELSAELADMMTRPGGVSVQLLANVYQIDEEDAEVLVTWAQKACQIRDEIGYDGIDAI
jgi:tetratricopeptide (TPR) repeat protein